jgi:hypothetical protein
MNAGPGKIRSATPISRTVAPTTETMTRLKTLIFSTFQTLTRRFVHDAEPIDCLFLAANRSAFYRGAQTVNKRHLRLLKFSARDGFGEKPGLINLWKTLEPTRVRWPFQLEQIRFELER